MRMAMMLKVMVKMDEVVMLPAGYPTVPTPLLTDLVVAFSSVSSSSQTT